MSAHSRWPLTTGVAQGRYYCSHSCTLQSSHHYCHTVVVTLLFSNCYHHTVIATLYRHTAIGTLLSHKAITLLLSHYCCRTAIITLVVERHISVVVSTSAWDASGRGSIPARTRYVILGVTLLLSHCYQHTATVTLLSSRCY